MLISILDQQPVVFTVTELNLSIKALLETSYPFVWVKGEISNFRVPTSGHYYFTLKDEHSQIKAVFFRPQNRNIRFTPESGLQVLCQGRLGVYEPRGEYQIIVEVMEPQGIGALQLAFEQLKRKLEAEGLFAATAKKPLPLCPREVAVVTSPTGAAIRDMIKVFEKCPYPLCVTIFPVRVQGQEACHEIAAAVEAVHRLTEQYEWDVLIVGRGGGSIEDLWPFNEEVVARAMFSCCVPTISAIGHEIDFTISDFVADHRAATPTAAAEWVVSQVSSFERNLLNLQERITKAYSGQLDRLTQRILLLEKSLTDPRKRLEDMRLFVDDRSDRLCLAINRHMEKLRALHSQLKGKLEFRSPLRQIHQYRVLVDQKRRELSHHHAAGLEKRRLELQKHTSLLETLNPLRVLTRGYSITYRLPDRKIVRKVSDVKLGDEVRVKLSEGYLECKVEEKVE